MPDKPTPPTAPNHPLVWRWIFPPNVLSPETMEQYR